MKEKIEQLLRRYKVVTGVPLNEPCPHRYGERLRFRDDLEGQEHLERWIRECGLFEVWPEHYVLFAALMSHLPVDWVKEDEELQESDSPTQSCDEIN